MYCKHSPLIARLFLGILRSGKASVFKTVAIIYRHSVHLLLCSITCVSVISFACIALQQPFMPALGSSTGPTVVAKTVPDLPTDCLIYSWIRTTRYSMQSWARQHLPENSTDLCQLEESSLLARMNAALQSLSSFAWTIWLYYDGYSTVFVPDTPWHGFELIGEDWCPTYLTGKIYAGNTYLQHSVVNDETLPKLGLCDTDGGFINTQHLSLLWVSFWKLPPPTLSQSYECLILWD